MIRADLQQLIANCDDDQCEILAGIVLRVMSIKAERWTGNLALSLNAVSGVVADMHVNRGEVVRLRKGISKHKNETVLSVM